MPNNIIKLVGSSVKNEMLQLSLDLGFYRWLRRAHTLLFHRSEYDLEKLFYSGLIKRNSLVFDVGANRGQSAEIFLLAGARVIAFEPQAELHREIKQRCSHLGQVVIEGVALGEKVERRNLFLRDYNQIASFREDWQDHAIGSAEVEVSTLDQKIKQYGKPDYCKIDVEGWELHVLRGLTVPIDLISFEYHLNGDEMVNTKSALQYLSAIDNYACNVRECGDAFFALDRFLAIEDFANRFPDDLGVAWHTNYGEIFLKSRNYSSETSKK